jgi:Polysaccharide pyruvyl transferase
MKAMIIGLGPEYNYPKNFELWSKENTRYASNHGASLISRAIAKQFDATFIDDFSKIDALNETYDTCFIAFATHITTWRDVSEYADVVEKLDMKVIALSLGVQDYMEGRNEAFQFHPSLIRLLKVVNSKSNYIGVRGAHTASLLYKNGFTNVLPIGCPTMYWNLTRDLQINKTESYSKPAIVYHRTLVKSGLHLMEDIPLIGQDFLDEAIFTDILVDDEPLVNYELNQYKQQGNFDQAIKLIEENGVFHARFKEWFGYLKKRDFVIGPRLHGCIASLIQGIPAVMLARDLRVQEIADFYNIPVLRYDELADKSFETIYIEADYTAFIETYPKRYDNYVAFLALNGLTHNLSIEGETVQNFALTEKDFSKSVAVLHQDLQKIELKVDDLKTYGKDIKKLMKLHDKLSKIKKRLRF